MPRRPDPGEGWRSPRWSRRRVGHGLESSSGSRSPPDGPLGLSGSGALPPPPWPPSWSSSSSRRRKNHTSHTTSAPMSKTRRPTMKIHPSSVTSHGRLALDPLLHQPPCDCEGRRDAKWAVLAARERPCKGVAVEPADVLELLVDPVRLAGAVGGGEADHQRSGERPGLRGDVLRRPDLDPGLLSDLPYHGLLEALTGLDEAGEGRVAAGRPDRLATEQHAVAVGHEH